MVRLRVVERVHMPSHLGIVLAIDTAAFYNYSKGRLARCDIVKNLQEGVIDQVNPQAEDVKIQRAHRVRSHDRRPRTDGHKTVEELVWGQVSQP
jgi:hypothetical protein